MEDTYRTYFESMPCFLSVQGRDFRIINANNRFRESFGDFEGRYCYQVYKQRPEKCERCPVERTFLDGLGHSSEEQVRTLDGQDISVLVYTTPIRDEAGDITAVMEQSTDVTELKGLQKQLQGSQKKYQLLFEEVPCYISIQDKGLNIVRANRQHREAFGTFYGCKCYKIYKGREKACDPCCVLQTFTDGKIHEHEEVVTRRDGNHMNVMVTTAPLVNADGEIDGVIEMSADITQIRELQSKLSSIGMIISSISHDLKGLLNGMDGGIYMVDTGLKRDSQERVQTGWEMVRRNVDRVRRTVLDILYYAKDRDPEWEEIRTKEIAGEVIDLMRARAANHKITFTADYINADGSFEADTKAVRSMLINLIDNSIDACRLDRSKESHEITVTATEHDQHVTFDVADNGIGMSEEVADKAFTLFFSSKGSGGTGLGLFIANKIAQSHGGSIELRSAPGEGARFTVQLPRHRPESPPPSADPAG